MSTFLRVNSFEDICYKQVCALVKRARKGAPFSDGARVTYADGRVEFIPLSKLLWRKATHPQRPLDK